MIPTSRRISHAFSASFVVLVRPLYPENVGAVARAMRVMGFENLILVTPHRLAEPTHEQARKMAVGSVDILERAQIVDSLERVSAQVDLRVATSARRRISGILSPRELGIRLAQPAQAKRIAWIFGSERTGLKKSELETCEVVCRIPMAGNEPSMNLSQAVLIVLYEVFTACLAQGPETERATKS